jgi:hypothetical protein
VGNDARRRQVEAVVAKRLDQTAVRVGSQREELQGGGRCVEVLHREPIVEGLEAAVRKVGSHELAARNRQANDWLREGGVDSDCLQKPASVPKVEGASEEEVDTAQRPHRHRGRGCTG